MKLIFFLSTITLCGFLGCQSQSPNSRERAFTVAEEFCGRPFNLESEGQRHSAYTLTGRSPKGNLLIRLVESGILVALSAPEKETQIQRGSKVPRSGPFNYEDPTRVKALIESKCKVVFPGHAYTVSMGNIRGDAKVGPELYKWGIASARFNILKGGYPWIDRLCGSNVEIDNKDGRLVYYQDRINPPPFGVAQTGITASTAKSRGAQILKVPEASLVVTGPGWAARESENGVLCYKVQRKGFHVEGTMNHQPTVNLFIRAKDGIEWKRTEL